MTKRFFNKLRMYLAVLKVLMDNKSKWETMAMFKTEITELNDHVLLIQDKRPESEQETGGLTEDKHSVKEELTDLLLDLSGQLHSVGDRTGNKELAAATDYEESDFKGRDADLPNITTNIVKLARANKTALADYGITDADVDELEKLGKLFAQKDTEPRAVVSQRKSAGMSLGDLYHETDTRLHKRLDKMMKRFRRTDAEFYRAYHSARLIIDYGVRHEKEEPTANGSTK